MVNDNDRRLREKQRAAELEEDRLWDAAHEPRFEYTAPISETVMEMRLRPLDGAGQRCLEFQLEPCALAVTPESVDRTIGPADALGQKADLNE